MPLLSTIRRTRNQRCLHARDHRHFNPLLMQTDTFALTVRHIRGKGNAHCTHDTTHTRTLHCTTLPRHTLRLMDTSAVDPLIRLKNLTSILAPPAERCSTLNLACSAVDHPTGLISRRGLLLRCTIDVLLRNLHGHGHLHHRENTCRSMKLVSLLSVHCTQRE